MSDQLYPSRSQRPRLGTYQKVYSTCQSGKATTIHRNTRNVTRRLSRVARRHQMANAARDFPTARPFTTTSDNGESLVCGRAFMTAFALSATRELDGTASLLLRSSTAVASRAPIRQDWSAALTPGRR